MNGKLIKQNIIVMVSTIVITVVLTSIFTLFYSSVYNISSDYKTLNTQVIVLEKSDVIYSTKKYSAAQIENFLITADLKNNKININEKEFYVTLEKDKNSEKYSIIKLSPAIDYFSYYQRGSLFVVVVFFITYVLLSIFANKNLKNILIDPIKKLKNQTSQLKEGDLDTFISDNYYGEIKELALTIEELRLKLKESVYSNAKFDENRKFLISSISHDLRTPVTAVRGYLEGMIDGVANTKEKQLHYMNKAYENTDIIINMIEDLLLYSKLDLNQLPFSLDNLNIVEFEKDVVNYYEFLFQKENKEIEFINKIESQNIYVDRKYLRRVFQNIIDNAKKHIDEKDGKVTVLLRETENTIITEIKDNGCGINKEHLEHIFDKFYKADNSRNISGGNGLGLSIAKMIVEGMNGKIWAKSTEKQGATIFILFKKVKNFEKNTNS